MEMPQLVVMAVLVEGRSKSEVARDYGVSRRWVITLVQRYLAEGEAGLQPRSRRPRSSPGQTPVEVEEQILAIRKELDRDGHDAGAETIAFHLQQRHGHTPSVSTIWRILKARGLVTPQPHKRPKSAGTRFPGRPAQRDAGHGHHPLAARRRHRSRDPQRPGRPQPARPDQHRPDHVHRPRGRPVLPPGHPRPRQPRRRAHRQRRHLHRPGPRRRPRHAGEDPASPPDPPGAHPPTTRRPTARSNDSTRPSRSGYAASHPPPP